MKDPTDPQRFRLYSMEETFMDAMLLTRSSRATLSKLAVKACRRWRVPEVRVSFAKNAYWYGEYLPDKLHIRLFDADKRKRKGSGRNPAVLLHEVAHHIDFMRCGDDTITAAHGPRFAAICMDLYDHYRLLPKAAFKLLAKRFRVRVGGIRRKQKSRR